MKFLLLTNTLTKTQWHVNIDLVRTIRTIPQGTQLSFTADEGFLAVESVDEILRMAKES